MREFLFRISFLLLGLGLVTTVPSDLTFDMKDELNEAILVKVGDRVDLRCSGLRGREDGTICPVWIHYSPGSNGLNSQDNEVYYCSGVVFREYSVRFHEVSDHNRRLSTLSITNITTVDAGRYECRDEITDKKYSKNIIVIDENSPKCSSASHTQFDVRNRNCGTGQKWNRMQLQCELSFTGSLNSNECIVEWRIVGQRDGGLSSDCSVSDGVVTSTLTLDRASHINGTSYICVVVKESSANEQYSCKTDDIFTSSGCVVNSLINPQSALTEKSTGKSTPIFQSLSPTSASSSSSSSSSLMNFHWTMLPVFLPISLSLQG